MAGRTQKLAKQMLQSPTGEKKACVFFGSPTGCRNGQTCRFLHSAQIVGPAISTPQLAKPQPKIPAPESASGLLGDAPQQQEVTAPAAVSESPVGPKPKRARTNERDVTTLRDDRGVIEWDELIKRTRAHPKYALEYAFPACDSPAGEGWMETKPCGDWCFGLPHVLAIDCEMCVVKNMKTGVEDNRALVRVTAVDGNNPDKVLLNDLVRQPANEHEKILETKEEIHGITAVDIMNASMTFRHAQAAFLRLACANAVVVGHSLHGDLKSMKIKHTKVVDTAYLYRLVIGDGSPALKDVAKAVLQQEMPEQHDSYLDAKVAMLAANHELRNGPSQPIHRAHAVTDLSKLRLHRIPKNTTPEELHQIFVSRARIVPVAVENIRWKDNVRGEKLGSTIVAFLTVAHAELAFSTIEGVANKDNHGRDQKQVLLAADGKSNRGYFHMVKVL